MALLGTFWHRITLNTLAGVTTTTYSHSAAAQATTPDLILPVAISIADATVAPALLALGANASLATVGLHRPSTNIAVDAVVAFDLYIAHIHSFVR